MARLENQTLGVDLTTVNPTIKVTCEFIYFPLMEVLTSVSGDFLLADGRKAANLIWNQPIEDTSYEVGFPDSKFREEREIHPKTFERSIRVCLAAELSPNVIDQIESLRTLKHPNVAQFSANLKFATLVSETEERNGTKTPKMKLKSGYKRFDFSINQSEWTEKFAAPLGIGKFLLMELRVIENTDMPDSWKGVFAQAQVRLADMELAIKRGAWQEAMQYGRQVFENLKVFDEQPANAALKEDFHAALKASNHTDDGIKDLENAIKHLFHYGSKFIHDKTKTLLFSPAPVATKEDAYMVYSLGLSILNVIGSKLHFFSLTH